MTPSQAKTIQSTYIDGMQQPPDAGRTAGTHDRLRQLDVKAREVRPVVVRAALVAAAAAAVENAREVDHRLAARGEALEGAGREDVGLHEIDGGQKGEVLGALAAACRHPDADAPAGKRGGEMPADKARAADDENALELHSTKGPLDPISLTRNRRL